MHMCGSQVASAHAPASLGMLNVLIQLTCTTKDCTSEGVHTPVPQPVSMDAA